MASFHIATVCDRCTDLFDRPWQNRLALCAPCCDALLRIVTTAQDAASPRKVSA